MYLRTILSGSLAMTLLAGGVAFAAPAEPSRQFAQLKLPSLGLPGVFGGKKQEREAQLAQAGDPRVTALEEQIRALSGTIEELNFQILQMQEQMRQMQEDNEFRFQEIEGKKSDASGGTDRKAAENPAPPADTGQARPVETAGRIIPPASVEDVIVDTQTLDPAVQGVPPKTFGTITFDESGNVTGGSVGDQTESIAGDPQPQQAAPEVQADNTMVAALPSSANPDELYRNSYEFVLSGDYGTAEAGFRDHISRFPADQKAADSHFWLGESLLAQKKYRDAAEVFLAANKAYPSAKKAPDMLLKLGVSLVGLDQRDVACATFSEIGKRYPDATGPLKERVKQEQALASC